VLPGVISFMRSWANAQAQGSDDLDHERDITLAIHAAMADLMRHQSSRDTGWQPLPHGLSETVRVKLTGEPI
jgi:hypothetical protein